MKIIQSVSTVFKEKLSKFKKCFERIKMFSINNRLDGRENMVRPRSSSTININEY